MKDFIKPILNSGKKHSAEILIGVGIASGIASTIFAVRGTTKAIKLIEKEEAEKAKKLTPTEMVKTTWTCYIWSALSCAMAVTCIIGGTSVNLRRNAALVTACKLSETALSEYRNKVVSDIGEKADADIRSAIAKDKLESNSPNQSNIIHVAAKGDVWCFEPLTGRYFQSDIDSIEKAAIVVNNKMISNGYASLNDFFEEIGLESSNVGDALGWNLEDGVFKISYTSRISRIDNDEIPCVVLDYYESPPTYDFDIYH